MEDSNINSDLVKKHIDMLFSTLQKLWDVRSKLFISTLIFSIVLVGISSGALSDIKNISASGINIKISISVIVSTAIFSITIMFGALSAVDIHSDRLTSEIARLYISLGYNDEGLFDNRRTPLEAPSVIHSTLQNYRSFKNHASQTVIVSDFVSATMAFIVFVILPIGSQIAGSIWLASQFHWHWISIVGTLTCIIFTFILIAASFKKVKSA